MHYLSELRREVEFVMDWLAPTASDDDRMTTAALLDLAERLAADRFAPVYRAGDLYEPELGEDGVKILPDIAAALRAYAESGLFAAGFEGSLGGMALPQLLCLSAFALAAAANISISAYAMLTIANARLIAAHGSSAQIEAFAKPQIEGRWFGTMCLSEPQAGSSLADIRTRAVPSGEDDHGALYRLTGNKMWISGADHDASENIVHLVLAKVPLADGSLPVGTAGISLFIVPRILPDGTANDVAVAGLNHKLGYRGIPNCLLNFGEGRRPARGEAGAIGWRLGAEGEGLRQMFGMMNEARIGVGVGAAALGYRGFRQALRYAEERTQGRAFGADASSAPVPIIAHADVRRMLLQQKVYAEGSLAITLFCAHLVDEGAAAEELLALLTPVAKSWASIWALAANDLAIQTHGGYGYTRDFDVEQLWRDNRLNPIHEGTTGIQALDLVGRKILRDRGGRAALRERIDWTCSDAAGERKLAPLAESLRAAWLRLDECIARIERETDLRPVLAEATPFLEAFGHAVLAWLWLDQACLCARRSDDFAAAKFLACQFLFETELPKIDVWLAQVTAMRGLSLEAAAAHL